MKKLLVVSVLLSFLFAAVPVYANDIEPRMEADVVDVDGEIREGVRDGADALYDEYDEATDEFVPIYDEFEDDVEEEATDDNGWLVIGGIVIIVGLVGVLIFRRMKK